jgi:hypothetical protein
MMQVASEARRRRADSARQLTITGDGAARLRLRIAAGPAGGYGGAPEPA